MVDVGTEAKDACEKRNGTPRKAAHAFLIGHLKVEIAMGFGFWPKVPSDATLRLPELGRSRIIHEDWRDALSTPVNREAKDPLFHGKI